MLIMTIAKSIITVSLAIAFSRGHGVSL